MKKILVVTCFAAIAVSSPAYALQSQITPLPFSGLTCGNLKGTWQFVANWEPLFDATKAPDPTTKKRPFFIDPTTGKPWANYQVGIKLAAGSQKGSGPCTLPNGGESQVVNCGGAPQCNILVTCPYTASSALVSVQGTGIASSLVRTIPARNPGNCN